MYRGGYILIDISLAWLNQLPSIVIDAVKQQSDTNNHTVQLLNMQDVKKLHSVRKIDVCSILKYASNV